MKKIALVLVSLIVSGIVFAQNAKSTGLTESDVKNWSKNIKSIEKELDKIGIDDDFDFSEVAKISAKKKAPVVAILNKNGISGENAIEKFAMINTCAALISAESELNDESIAMMKQFGIDPLKQLKVFINDKDLAVVRANSKSVSGAVKDYETEFDMKNISSGDDDDDDYENPYVTQANNFRNSMAQKYIDEINDEAFPEEFYEDLVESKGDSGFVYKSVDAKNASKYTKQKISKDVLCIENGIDFSEDVDLRFDNYNELGGKVDFKKNSVEFLCVWTKASLDSKSAEGMKKELVRKSKKFSIKSAELYAFVDGKSGSTSKEYVISTKEGLVLHLWSRMSDDGNAYERVVKFSGLDDDFDLNWYEE